MASRRSRSGAGPKEQKSPARFGAAPTEAGLNAEEWDLLRASPDYDADEMANVWPATGIGGAAPSVWSADAFADEEPEAWTPPADDAVPGWIQEPQPVEDPAEASELPAEAGDEAPESSEPSPSFSWSPPNRIELPTRLRGAGGSSSSETTRQPFPEERTLALMAEDLLGRPLDEPAPQDARSEKVVGGSNGSAAASDLPLAAALPASLSPRHADLWDQVMPLWGEGAGLPPGSATEAVSAPRVTDRPGFEPKLAVRRGTKAGGPPVADVLEEALVAGERAGLMDYRAEPQV